MPDMPTPRPAATRRIPLAVGAVAVGALIGFAAIYGYGAFKRGPAGDSACNGAVDLARKIFGSLNGKTVLLVRPER